MWDTLTKKKKKKVDHFKIDKVRRKENEEITTLPIFGEKKKKKKGIEKKSIKNKNKTNKQRPQLRGRTWSSTTSPRITRISFAGNGKLLQVVRQLHTLQTHSGTHVEELTIRPQRIPVKRVHISKVNEKDVKERRGKKKKRHL